MWQRIIWNDESDGNISHIEANDVTIDDVEFVLENCSEADTSRASGFPCVFGHTPDGRYIIIVYESIDDDTVYPVTAYEVPEPADS